VIKRLPWLRKVKKNDPEAPLRLPIACGPVSNGEGWWPDSPRKKLIRQLVIEKADEVSRREGIDRREFMASACGMATSLYMINMVNGCSNDKTAKDNRLGMGGSGGSKGKAGSGGSSASGSGGFGGITKEMMEDEELAACALGMGGNELIIDMQSHFASPETNPTGAAGLASFIGQINNTRFPWIQRTAGCSGPSCLDRKEYLDQFFMGSDTTIGVLSGISYSLGANGMGSGGVVALSNEDLLDGAKFLAGKYPKRMLTHCMVMPNDRIEIQLAMMERNAGTYDNWKTYPPWSPRTNGGYWLNEDVGPMMIQKGLDLNSPIFCIHKGFPLSGFSPTYTNPKDVGPAANMFPDAYLVIYHSAFEHGLAAGESTMADVANPTADVGWGPGVGKYPEGPYDEEDEEVQKLYPLDRGVNSLIQSLRLNNIGPNGTRLDGSAGPKTKVYAECGGVWPNLMTNRAEEGMHYWGKLLKHIGEDRIVWGTDCLWFGSPQPVIQAFRAFEISKEFQEKYGYPELTKARKEKILGQNAARLQNVRNGIDIHGCHSDYAGTAFLDLRREIDEEFGPRRDMIVNVPGPRTRREFLALRASEHQEKLKLSGRVPARG
jgi:predicted TIM-barrel fold metal-dependent hydrolase